MTTSKRTPRRSDPLSLDRIVNAAIGLLDEGGKDALTVRTLTAQLSTGRGAIYHHVSSIETLMASAADAVTLDVVDSSLTQTDPESSIRAFAAGLFDVIDLHPWVGAQLSRDPAQPAVFRIWTTLGGQLARLGLPAEAQSDAGAALVNYVLGSAAQHPATAKTAGDEAARQTYLDDLARAWVAQNPDGHVEIAAAQLRDHDDRAQFLSGVDIFLRGIFSRPALRDNGKEAEPPTGPSRRNDGRP